MDQQETRDRQEQAIRRISREMRELLAKKPDGDTEQWRGSLAQLVERGREARLRPEELVIALKSEWIDVRGNVRRVRDSDELNQMVSFCIDCYYRDGSASRGQLPE